MKINTVVILLSMFGLIAPASARTRIIVLPPDAAQMGVELKKQIAETVLNLPAGDQLLVYAANPLVPITTIRRPSDASMSKARVNAVLAGQLRPVLEHLALASAPPDPGPPVNIMIPLVVDELGRDVLPSLPDKGAEILLIGSWFFVDRRDAKSAMVERAVPSDATLRAPRGEWPYSVVSAEQRLIHSTLYFCMPGGANAFESARHEERVRRWWSVWTVAQAGRVGVMSFNLQTCFARFNAGESSGQSVYPIQRDGKPEMQRVSEPMPLGLPTTFAAPGIYFLKEDMPLSRTPPLTTKGVAWIGIKWSAPGSCDLDLWARAEPGRPWLFFGNSNAPEGTFNKDWTGAPDEGQFEYIAFKEIDLNTAEAFVNVYACDATAPPEGKIRIWFGARVWEGPFKFGVRTGNKGGPTHVGRTLDSN